MISCSTRKVFSISFSRPCQSGTRWSPMMRSARSKATPARIRCCSESICAITWSVMYMKNTNAAVAGSMRKTYSRTKSLSKRASGVAGEQVPSQAHGLDHRLGTARVLELAAKPADARVDGTVEAVVVDASHDAQDFIARDDSAVARGEKPQDVEVAGGELDGARVQRGRAARAVDGEAAHRERRFRRGPGARARAAQQRFDAREQHSRLHGLHDIVVGAHLESQHLVDVLALGGEDEDRHRAAPAKLAADREPILAGQHEVEDDELGLQAVEALGGHQAVALDRHLVAVAFQVVANGSCQPRAVFDEQHPGVTCGGR